MFVTDVNDVKIYNLSAGKSIPDWLTDRKKKSQLKKNVDSRRQIELIQEFAMPALSTSIRMSPDNQYIIATGTYKPRVKCFEVSNLSIKFERCFDSEVTTFEVLSDDYSKMVFLQCDRYIELHAAHGRHYRLRIPRFGRDMSYHKPLCDLFIVGTTSDIYRLNLERGQFLQPYPSDATCINTCEINPEHHLLVVGTQEGTVEAWDPRERRKCSTLDVAMKFPDYKQFPQITALKFKNGLHMGVGTASGHVLIYDIRAREPLFIKDHLNKLPIKKINFNSYANAVCSLDSAMLKIWDETTGKQKAYIESLTKFNDFCTIEDSGMFFLAQEDVKMLTYYIPTLGPAPRWCSFLDNLTEEIESEVVEDIYDDYKFITRKELQDLELDHLEGTKLLRAYMHGYFIDVRLYNKALAAADPFAFDKYRKEKIRQEVEAQRPARLQINTKLPKVNQELALKILEQNQNVVKSKKQKHSNLLEDTRFKAMFENPEYKIDKNAEEYKMLTPVLNRLDKGKLKALKKKAEVARVEELHAEEHQVHNSDDDDEDLFNNDRDDDSDNDNINEDEATSDEDVKEFAKEMKKTYKKIKIDREKKELEELQEREAQELTKMIEFENVNEFKVNGLQKKSNKHSLQDRLKKQKNNDGVTMIGGSLGNRQMNFDTKPLTKEMKKREYEMKKHREERKKLIRPINSLKLKKSNYK